MKISTEMITRVELEYGATYLRIDNGSMWVELSNPYNRVPTADVANDTLREALEALYSKQLVDNLVSL